MVKSKNKPQSDGDAGSQERPSTAREKKPRKPPKSEPSATVAAASTDEPTSASPAPGAAPAASPQKRTRARAGSAARAAGSPRKTASSSRATSQASKRSSRGDEPADSEREDAASESESEPRDRDDDYREDEGAASEREGDNEVVEVVGEVVGELVDEESLDGEDARLVDRGERKTTSPPLDRDEVALSRTDPLQAYLREVQRHSLLTPDEEKSLTVHYTKTQDVRTAARLVTANLRLVVKLAYEYRRAYKNIMDLIQEGNIGLMQAVKRYDPYRGVKLSSYAAWWIRAYILRFILNNWRLVKLGTTQAQRKLFFNLNKEKAKLSALGIEPSASEIARRLSVDEQEVVDMDRRLSSGEASLDAPVGDTDGRAVSRIEMLPSQTSGPDIAFEASEMGKLVHERLTTFRETLKGKDVIIFDKRMTAEEPLTLQELGDEFGISRERVRQLEARLTMKLRTYLKEELGDAVGAS